MAGLLAVCVSECDWWQVYLPCVSVTVIGGRSTCRVSVTVIGGRSTCCVC